MNSSFRTTFGLSAADSAPVERASFIRKTYLHLAAAILLFIGIEAALFSAGFAQAIASTLLGTSWSWLIVLVLFMVVASVANWWANSQTSKGMQYLGLLLYVIAEAIIFVPLLYVVAYYSGGGMDTIMKAGVVSLGLFAGLTTVVLVTRSDFSFLGPILAIGGFVALGFIVASILFGFTLGSVFILLMIAFAATAILYSTSNVLHQYSPTQHVAAALSLFASVALLFWYILAFFNSSDD